MSAVKHLHRKRAFDEPELANPTQSSLTKSFYSPSLSQKRAKTAPSSPVSRVPVSQFVTPQTPRITLPELPLTPPSTVGCATFRSQLADSDNDESSSPATPPPSTQSSPRRFAKILRLDRKPFNIAPESSFYYPDTCYSFNLLNPSTSIPETNERCCIQQQQNNEWRNYYHYKVSHDNSRGFRKYREYCEGLKMSEPSSGITKPSLKKLTNKKLLPASSKLTSFIERQFNRYDGLVNYPYAASYRYQSTSPELYHTSYDGTRSGSVTPGELRPRNCMLPPLQEVLEMSSLRPAPLATTKINIHSRRRNSVQKPARSPARSPKVLSVSKFINTSVVKDRTTTTTVSTKPSSPRRHAHGSHMHRIPRSCISCHSTQSPCWRPSWAPELGQLCNSCGLRYKKTRARCLNESCLRIPAKGEWSLMKNRGKVAIKEYDDSGNEIGEHYSYKCLHCDGEVAVDEI